MKIGLHSFGTIPTTCNHTEYASKSHSCGHTRPGGYRMQGRNGPSKHHLCAARRTCLLISAPAWTSHSRHSGWPPNAAMWVGVCANLEVTAFTSQPIWTRRITHSSCVEAKQVEHKRHSVYSDSQTHNAKKKTKNPKQTRAGMHRLATVVCSMQDKCESIVGSPPGDPPSLNHSSSRRASNYF